MQAYSNLSFELGQVAFAKFKYIVYYTVLLTTEHATTLITQRGIHLLFWSYKGRGKLFIDGVPTKFELAENIDDCKLLEQGSQIFLLLSVTREKMHQGDEYILEVSPVRCCI